MFYALFAKNLQICTCLFINVNQSNNHDACLALPYSKHGKMFWATTHPFHFISCKNPWQSLLTCCWACANCHHLFFDLVSHIRGSIPAPPLPFRYHAWNVDRFLTGISTITGYLFLNAEYLFTGCHD